MLFLQKKTPVPTHILDFPVFFLVQYPRADTKGVLDKGLGGIRSPRHRVYYYNACSCICQCFSQILSFAILQAPFPHGLINFIIHAEKWRASYALLVLAILNLAAGTARRTKRKESTEYTFCASAVKRRRAFFTRIQLYKIHLFSIAETFFAEETAADRAKKVGATLIDG